MSLSIQDKLALMLTSAGSQRNLASLIGVSHQKIGRWLQGEHVNMHTGVISNIPTDPHVVHAINQAFSMHRDVARQQARHDRLPFNPAIPVYMERKAFRDGRPGERVIAEHTQWISNDLRERVMVSAGQSRAYINVSVRSVVDLRRYNDRANVFARSDAAKGVFRTEAQNAWRAGLREELDNGIVQKPMYTQKEDFVRLTLRKGEVLGVKWIRGEEVSSRIDTRLRQKHEPATGEAGTRLADQFLFQTLPKEEKPHVEKAARSTRARKAKGRS